MDSQHVKEFKIKGRRPPLNGTVYVQIKVPAKTWNGIRERAIVERKTVRDVVVAALRVYLTISNESTGE